MKLGIFGGTFNPIHFGHLRAAEEAREMAGLDKILFIPSGTPPLKSADIAPARHRFAMTSLAVEKNPCFTVLDLECRLPRKSYTVHTLEKLRQAYADDSLFFLLGIDAFLDIPNWYRPDLLLLLTNFIVLSRPGSRFADLAASPYLLPAKRVLRKLDAWDMTSHAASLASGRTALLMNILPVNISSTDIRTRIKQGRSIKYLLPAEVESYIILKKLYEREKSKDRAAGRGCL